MSKLIFFIIFVVFILRKIAEASRGRQQSRSGQRQRREEVELSDEALQTFLQQRKPQGQGQPAPPPPQRPQFAPGARPDRDDEEVVAMFRADESPSTIQARGAPPPPSYRPAPPPQTQLPAFLQKMVAPMIEAQQPMPPELPADRKKQERREKKKKKPQTEKTQPPLKARSGELADKSLFRRLEQFSLFQRAIIYKEVFGKPGGKSFEDI